MVSVDKIVKFIMTVWSYWCYLEKPGARFSSCVDNSHVLTTTLSAERLMNKRAFRTERENYLDLFLISVEINYSTVNAALRPLCCATKGCVVLLKVDCGTAVKSVMPLKVYCGTAVKSVVTKGRPWLSCEVRCATKGLLWHNC